MFGSRRQDDRRDVGGACYDPGQDTLRYEPYDRYPSALFSAGPIGDATKVDLASLRDSGGKLIMWQGGADAAFSPRSTWTYYGDLVAASGGQAAADTYVRAYEASGVAHCSD